MKILIAIMSLVFGCGLDFAAGSIDPYQYFDNNGVKIAYREFGSGRETLIVINGGPGRSSDTFAPLAQNLASLTYKKIIIFDQRGTGRSKLSTLDETTLSLELMISDLEALRLHLGLAKISVLGHSFGGIYAMTYAARYPANVEQLILSCSGGFDLSWQQYTQHNMLSRLTNKARRRYDFWTSEDQYRKDPVRSSLNGLKELIPAYIYHRKFVPRLEKDLLNLNYYTPAVNSLVWKSMSGFNIKKDLAAVTARTLILSGRQDILGEAVPIGINQAIPNSTLEFIDECSHYPWLDNPKRYFALIADFLR